MVLLALAIACAGHADPVSPGQLEVEGATVTLSDETSVAVQRGVLAQDATVRAEQVVAKDGDLEIRAPRTEWDLKTRTATLSGGVTARRGVVDIRCAQMVVTFSSPGRVSSAVATGDVRITHGQRSGTGTKAVLSTSDGTIVLTGKPTLKDGSNRMAGTQITLHMDADKVTCDDCRLQIASGAVTPGTPSP